MQLRNRITQRWYAAVTRRGRQCRATFFKRLHSAGGRRRVQRCIRRRRLGNLQAQRRLPCLPVTVATACTTGRTSEHIAAAVTHRRR
ncbi:hypothetical protein D3C81_1874470 [compost metagenome]